ncbi:MAG: DUF882 domain-containing protein [Proteobacteria bacterium]|nr:DUF882 domain-containing protein [Pseudomonadota bacterium]
MTLLRPLLLSLLLLLPGGGNVLAQGSDNPMRIAPVLPPVVDDEPESANVPPENGATSAERLKLITAPLPPQRPWMGNGAAAVAAPPAGTQPPQMSAVNAPLPPRRPETEEPEAAEPSPEPPPQPEPKRPAAPSFFTFFGAPSANAPLVNEPDHRLVSLPSTAMPSTTEEIEAEEEKAPEPMLVEKQTDSVDIACLQPELLKLVRVAGEHFGGTPVITSGQRDRGRRGSYHRKCMAADFFIPGIERARLAKYLRALPGAGGVGTYCHTKSVHIDIGEPRNWWQCGFRFRFAQR